MQIRRPQVGSKPTGQERSTACTSTLQFLLPQSPIISKTTNFAARYDDVYQRAVDKQERYLLFCCGEERRCLLDDDLFIFIDGQLPVPHFLLVLSQGRTHLLAQEARSGEH